MIRTSFVLTATSLSAFVVDNFSMTDYLQRNHLLSNALFVRTIYHFILPRFDNIATITFREIRPLFVRELKKKTVLNFEQLLTPCVQDIAD